MINFILSSSINTDYSGQFNDVATTISANRTNQASNLFGIENNCMTNKQVIDNLNVLLSNRFNNDVGSMAHALGIPIDIMRNLLLGNIDIPQEIIKRLDDYNAKGDYFQFGDRIEINNSGDGYTQSFSDLTKSNDDDYIKKLKIENSDLKKMLKDKDELISALKETIELLKKK